ncbi:MAG: TcpQ domain-containing protein [Pseudomonadota bacterium]
MTTAAHLRPIVRITSVILSALLLSSPALAGFEWMPAPTPQGPPMPAAINAAKAKPTPKPPYVSPTVRAFQERAKIQRPDGWGHILTPPAPGQAQAANSVVKTTPPSTNGMQTLTMGGDNDFGENPRTAGMQHKTIGKKQNEDGFKTAEITAETESESETKKEPKATDSNAPVSLTEGLDKSHSIAKTDMSDKDKMRAMAKAQMSDTRRKKAIKSLPSSLSPVTSKKPSAVHANVDTRHYNNAIGFGIDMPLAFALGQIIPEGYTYALEQGVNLGTKVSWNGGKPWPVVVQDMIAPLGLNVAVQGTKAYISRSGAPLQLAAHDQGSSAKSARKTTRARPSKTQSTSQREKAADAKNEAKRRRLSSASGSTRSPLRKTNHRMKATNPLIPESTDKKPKQYDDGIQEPVPVTKRTKRDQPLPDHILRQRAKTPDQPIQITEHAVQFWQAHKGQNLRDVLISWSPKANIELDWESTEDYRLAENVLIHDTFSNALVEMFTEHLTEARAPEVSFVETAKDGKAAKLIVKDRRS